MEYSYDELKKKYDDLLFENHVLKVENEFMKNNIKRLYELNNTGDVGKNGKVKIFFDRVKNKIRNK